jgi:hypothetical protein
MRMREGTCAIESSFRLTISNNRHVGITDVGSSKYEFRVITRGIMYIPNFMNFRPAIL